MNKLQTNSNHKEIFPEHEFLASCLRVGLHIADLKELTYVDVMKILITFISDNSKALTKEATQNDIDRLLG